MLSSKSFTLIFVLCFVLSSGMKPRKRIKTQINLKKTETIWNQLAYELVQMLSISFLTHFLATEKYWLYKIQINSNMMSQKALALFFILCLILCSGLKMRKHSQQENQQDNQQYFDEQPPIPKDPRIQMTKDVGRHTGLSFDQYEPTLSEVRQIIVSHGDLIDSIQFEYENGERSKSHGGWGGSYDFWRVPTGEHIEKVNLRAGDVIDSIQFITDKGSRSPRWGQDGGDSYTIEIPTGYKIVGFFGGDGQWLDRIGFNIVPMNETG